MTYTNKQSVTLEYAQALDHVTLFLFDIARFSRIHSQEGSPV